MPRIGYRYCCVTDCHNNGRVIKQWESSTCDKHKVLNGSQGCDCTFHFFLTTFPTKDKSLAHEWIQRINRKNWIPNYNTRICSDHFVDVDLIRKRLSPQHPYPTLKLGYELTGERTKQKRKPPISRINSPTVHRKRPKKVVEENHKIIDISSSTTTSEPNSECHSCNCIDYKARIKELEKEVLHWKTLYYRKQEKRFNLGILSNDKRVKTYTGLPSKEVFDNLFDSFGDKVKKIRKWKGPGFTVAQRQRFHHTGNRLPILTAREEYFMTLFRTKTMLRGDIVADLFGISTSSVSQICKTWWKFLAKELKPLIHNPPSEVHRALLPASFNTGKYKKVEHIIDCTEVFTETPKKKDVQASLWSNYKHHYTSKFLVSITASGLINFASRGYGGRSSDRQIVEHSGFLDEIRPGECVMADKGFNIPDLLTLKHAELVIPPGRRGAFQMPKKDVQLTKEIANRQIRVEQVIRRIKSFAMLRHEIPMTLLHTLDDVFILCCAICNLMPL